MLFSKPTRAVGIDIGTHSVKAVQMSRSGGRLRIDNVGYAVVDRNQVAVDPIAAQANALREALRTIPIAQTFIVGALPGQTVVIRYPRFAEMPEGQLADSVEREAGQNIPYERSEVFLDWTPLETVTEGGKSMVKVLLVAARYEVIESRVQVASESEIAFSALTVDSLALADAAEGCDFLRVGESVAMVNLGAQTTSIHFIKDSRSNFIRDVSWGSRELVQAISKARRMDVAEAERVLMTFGNGKQSVESAVPPPLPAQEPPQPEPAPAPQPPVGGNPLDPLEDELGGLGGLDSLGSAPTAKPAAQQAPVEEKDLGEILGGPLARLVSEIRRSFDYYEQQLYEHPVDRMIVSGGVAHFPLLRQTLADELGVPVELADPTRGALVMGPDHAVGRLIEQPAQYMVAVGLAARGMAEL